ncbi:hypothetical protein JCM3765_003379 [Sporobolomyces pararoseus]
MLTYHDLQKHHYCPACDWHHPVVSNVKDHYKIWRVPSPPNVEPRQTKTSCGDCYRTYWLPKTASPSIVAHFNEFCGNRKPRPTNYAYREWNDVNCAFVYCRPKAAPADWYQVIDIEDTTLSQAQDAASVVEQQQSQVRDSRALGGESSTQPVVHRLTTYTYSTPSHSWLERPLSPEEQELLERAGDNIRNMTLPEQHKRVQEIKGDLARRSIVRRSLDGIHALLKEPRRSTAASDAQQSLSKTLSYRQAFNYFHLSPSQHFTL